MAYSFNVFSGTLDQVGSSAVVFEGEVETFADLPEAVGDPAVGASYLVRTSTGVWLVNRRQAGIWIRKNNTGVRATDWEYGGDYPVNSVAGKTGNVTLTNSDISGLGTAATANLNAISDADLRIVGSTDSTKKVAIEVDTNVPANTTVTLTAPSASGTLALAGAAPASHTHGNITNDGLVGTTANLPLKTGTGGIVEAGAFGTTSGTFAAGDDSRITGAAQKSANLSDLASASTARTNLGLGTAATAATGDFAAASHNHAASAITSGVLDNARINFAAPSAIGALIPNTGLFTNLSVTSRLNLPSSGSNANDIWVSSGQVRYQAGSLVTSARTLLTAEDNLSNLGNTATARTNLGVGSSDAVTFGSIQNTPIGSTTPAAGSFTNLLASAELTVPAVTPASPSTGDLYRTTDMLRYRDSSNTERILLNNLDNLANLGNTATARTNIGLGNANDVTFGSIQNTPIGSITAAAITGTTGTFTTLNATNGTITASAPVLDLSQTWNASGTTFTALRLNATNTASASGSLLMDLQVGGTSVANIRRDGRVLATSFAVVSGAQSGAGFYYHSATEESGHIAFVNNVNTQMWTCTASRFRLAGDLSFGRSAGLGQSVDTVLVRDDAGTLAQRNAANAQTFRLYNTFTDANNHERGFLRWSSNVFQIGTEKGSGGGSARPLQFVIDGVNMFELQAGGSIVANRSFVTSGGYGVTSDSHFTLQTATGQLRWGGTSSVPMLKRSSAIIQARLGDDSAYTTLDAQLRAQGTAPATSGAAGTAGDIRYDADYIYVCTAASTWKRVAIATW